MTTSTSPTHIHQPRDDDKGRPLETPNCPAIYPLSFKVFLRQIYQVRAMQSAPGTCWHTKVYDGWLVVLAVLLLLL